MKRNQPVLTVTTSRLGGGRILLGTRDGDGSVTCVALSMADVSILITQLRTAVLASLDDGHLDHTLRPEEVQ